MGFFRDQQEKLAVRLLAWRYQKLGIEVPGAVELHRRAVAIVDEAHRIARERGSNVLSIVKDLVEDVKNKPL